MAFRNAAQAFQQFAEEARGVDDLGRARKPREGLDVLLMPERLSYERLTEKLP